MKIVKGRMLRKDISRSEKIASLSPEAWGLFCFLIPHFNAHGKMNGNPLFIKGEICPIVPWLDVKKIERLLVEIHEKTNVKWWTNGNGLYYLQSLSWKEHQSLREDRLGDDDMPDYPGEQIDKSGSSPGVVQDNSPLKFKEKFKEKENIHTELWNKVRLAFSYWQEVFNHPKSQLDQTRKHKIMARLKEGRTLEEIKQAIDNCKADDWEGREKYHDIELICRNTSKFEYFLNLQQSTTKGQAVLEKLRRMKDEREKAERGEGLSEAQAQGAGGVEDQSAARVRSPDGPQG
jgi:uncharacterized phage protein (TIGR02220 family)